MTGTARAWAEKEWESYANALLSSHYGLKNVVYQRIPALGGGDCGLEGLSDTGEGYQCYADQNSKSNADRTRKQKNKITEDIDKLEANQVWWNGFLGPKKIRLWVLVVPYLDDKKVVSHVRSKARALLAKSLSFIDPNFQGAVMTADDFPAAKAITREEAVLKAGGAPVTASDISLFSKSNPTFVRNLEAKLQKVLGVTMPRAKLEEFRDKLLNWHLGSSNYLSDLHTYFPMQSEDLRTLIGRKGDSIETDSVIDLTSPRIRLSGVRTGLKETLKTEQKFMGESERETVSWGTVAKWLGDCPLSFPEGCNA